MGNEAKLKRNLII